MSVPEDRRRLAQRKTDELFEQVYKDLLDLPIWSGTVKVWPKQQGMEGNRIILVVPHVITPIAARQGIQIGDILLEAHCEPDSLRYVLHAPRTGPTFTRHFETAEALRKALVDELRRLPPPAPAERS